MEKEVNSSIHLQTFISLCIIFVIWKPESSFFKPSIIQSASSGLSPSSVVIYRDIGESTNHTLSSSALSLMKTNKTK